MTLNKIPTAVAALMTIALAGCGSLEERAQVQVATQQGSDTVRERLAAQRETDTHNGAAVREFNAVWLGGKTVKVAREAQLPAVFGQAIRFSFPDRPTLTTIGDRISKITGISVRVSPDALVPIQALSAQRLGTMMSTSMQASSAPAPAPSAQIPGSALPAPLAGAAGQLMPAAAGMAGAAQGRGGFILDQMTLFGGSLTELLDQISAKYSVGWDYSDGAILISRLVTRTYHIASITDVNDITSTITKKASTGQSTSSSGTEAGSQVGSAASSSDVSSRVTSQIDVVKGLQTAIESTLTPSLGKYAISSSGVVTVTDTREVQEQIRELIAAENKAIGRQVRMRMQIVEVTANTGNDVGIDWSWAISQATAKWSTEFFSPTGMASTASGFGQLGVLRRGGQFETQAFLKALATIGRVSVRKDETYTMLNNRPMSVASTESFIYPARSSAATTTTTSTTAIPGVEPGQLTTGTFLNLRTSIQPNSSVIVQFSMDASTRGEVKTYQSNGATLQYPQTNANQYQLYTSIVSGETAVLAGIDNTQQTSNDRALDGKLSPLLGGGFSASTTRRAVLVMLTPQIIEGVN
ncbi:hypothetical protein [Alicycliphilus denitrificans]|uniref:hypothetical protein n=1 Tax=Alicycliphilus denitrificans TaxID=179636 RepID=UPI00384F0BA8